MLLANALGTRTAGALVTPGFTVQLRAPCVQWLTYSSLYSQCQDCYKGVVFDGLESLFARSLESSLLCVLRAVKNRHHIFMVHLRQDYASWKAKDEAEKQRKKTERENESEISLSLSNLLSQALKLISVCLGLQQRL